MITLNSPQVVQETVLRWKREGKIAFVPTMGALHEGHLQLVRRAKHYGSRVIVSIFVNPLQFGPNEDLSKYPRSLEADEEKLRELDVDLLFTPEVTDLYPPGFRTRVVPEKLTQSLCGKSRPGHFEGVATVCLKLFLTTQADFAVFGEKDFQQLRVIQQMTADFNMPLTILPHPTVREDDGLALSSRNRYLSPEQRSAAAAFPRALAGTQNRALEDASLTAGSLLETLRAEIARAGLALDYVDIASEGDLVPVAPTVRLAEIAQPRVFGAVKVGTTRLIDNWKLYRDQNETAP
jgi:pantoate--beta-alanine ligase